jgi:YebC/PmpR family DNA-binding regulatory protein
MAGHSKWSKVKRFKGALDAKRGRLFSKLSKEITVAAKLGGGNPSANPRLRAAIQAARTQSMPNDNIDRAVKKGTGELGSQTMEEIIYEGYAPGGVALIVEAATDNKNRTAADMRSIFSKNHGNLGGPGSVSFMFHRKGQITIPLACAGENRLFELIADLSWDTRDPGDEPVRIADGMTDHPRQAVSLCNHLVDSTAAHADQRELGHHKKTIHGHQGQGAN